MEEIKGFKGFDKNLKCKDFQYEVGKVFSIEETPKLCSRGFHLSPTLKDAMAFYPNKDGNRYCEVIALGDIDKSSEKVATNKIHILKELSCEDICATIEDINLELVKQACLAGGIIGGSLGLKLQGYDLGRPVKDIDFIFANADNVNKVFKSYSNAELGSCIIEQKGVSNRRAFYDKSYNKTYDVFIQDQPFKEIVFYGVTVKVSNPLSIWRYKLQYAMQGHTKHYMDFLKYRDRLEYSILIKDTTTKDELSF